MPYQYFFWCFNSLSLQKFTKYLNFLQEILNLGWVPTNEIRYLEFK